MTRLAPVLLGGVLIVALLSPWQHSRHAAAQNPFPTGVARNTSPGLSEPNDGADVLVVEGLGAGLGGCNYTLDLIKYITIAGVNAGRRTITEITPQSGCSSNLQDWKNVIYELVLSVVTQAPNSELYWGGVMLDEEPEFWTSSDDVTAFVELNAFTRSLMIAAGGVSWFFTENFVGTNGWSQQEFDLITGESFPAPQIATDYMIQLSNSFYSRYLRPILVTWSLDYPLDFASLYRAASRINGPPLALWGLNMSNCFTLQTMEPRCGPDQDHDGIIAGVEFFGGINPNDKDTDDDGCSDGEETGIFPSLGGVRQPGYFWDFFDVTGDKFIDFSDALDITGFFGDPALPGTPGNLRDRDIGGPNDWNAVESNTGVDLNDTLAMLGSFGHGCTGPP
jgi:hypothetical protein